MLSSVYNNNINPILKRSLENPASEKEIQQEAKEDKLLIDSLNEIAKLDKNELLLLVRNCFSGEKIESARFDKEKLAEQAIHSLLSNQDISSFTEANYNVLKEFVQFYQEQQNSLYFKTSQGINLQTEKGFDSRR